MGIVITAEEREVIEVDLVGVHYQVTPPKASLALKIAVQAKQADENDPEQALVPITSWLGQAMGEEQAAAIRARLDDPDDLLDLSHVMKLMEKIIEVGSGNPPTSPSGSRKSRSTTGGSSTAGPAPKG